MSRTAAVITVSDKGFRGERTDTAGPAVVRMLEQAGFQVVRTALVPDEMEDIRRELCLCADELRVALAVTVGGTGFSPRDVTPEATLAAAERQVPGIPEEMRRASMAVTPRGCLSRSAAGIRGRTLMVNLPGSEKAAGENLSAVLGPLGHGVDMLQSEGSADCGERPVREAPPSLDQWLQEAKSAPEAEKVGMYLAHCGVVRATARAQVRRGEASAPVTGMDVTYDPAKVDSAVAAARAMPGICYVRVWLNRGRLQVGEDLMRVLVGGDIRPHVLTALEALVGELKRTCITERELCGPDNGTTSHPPL